MKISMLWWRKRGRAMAYCLALGQCPISLAVAQNGAPAAAAPAQDSEPAVRLPSIPVIGSTPLPGSGIAADKAPGQVNVLKSNDLLVGGMPNLTGALQQQVGGITLDNAAGNPYQPDLFYHGFRASALQGVEQGLAVYVNGVRFNQVFGDTVNWDLIANDAIDQVNLVGSNPAFGLNAIGGALNVTLKNGFTYHGGEASISGGSFNKVEGDVQYGQQSGNVAGYIALSGVHEDGWRDLQSSDVQNVFADLGWRNDRSELHITVTGANSRLNGPGTAPVELLAADPKAQFTAPNAVYNNYLQIAAAGNTQINDTTSLQANAYYGYFRQRVVNGNAPDFAPCNDGSGLLCEAPGVPLTGRGGVPISDYLNGGPYSELDQQTTVTNSYGSAVQVTNSNPIFGMNNQVVAGLSFDGGVTDFGANSQVGGLSPNTRVFIGPGPDIDQADGSIVPVRVYITNANYGVFASDTIDLVPRLSLTASGRFNATQIDLNDQDGSALNGNHFYDRFNPALGLAYKATNWLTAYAGYSEANRAPTPAELSCASAAAPCSLANFFVGDPNLKQVVSRTYELGVRGKVAPFNDATLSYDIGLFHSNLDDDIAFVNSVVLGRAFFQNVGTTQRQGVDAGLRLTTPRWQAWIGYSYTNATFRSGFVESGGNNPATDANGNITVNSGARLPGIPANQVKLGVSYKITDAWTVGLTGVGVSGSYLFGDEANLTAKLPGYVVMNFNTSYQVTDHIQIFGSIENITDQRYYVYGTFSPTSSVFLAQAPGATNPRSYNIGAPVGGFGGVKVTF